MACPLVLLLLLLLLLLCDVDGLLSLAPRALVPPAPGPGRRWEHRQDGTGWWVVVDDAAANGDRVEEDWASASGQVEGMAHLWAGSKLAPLPLVEGH